MEQDSGTMALVVAGHEIQFPDPLTMNTGDELQILPRKSEEWPGWVFCESKAGKKGWVPESILTMSAEKAVAKQNYDSREVSVMEGEIVRIEKTESGWAWVTNMTNETGWVPLKNLKLVE